MHQDAATLDPPAAAEASPKRRQMLDAARRLFLAQGYGAVSMDAVARTAGVSKATLYAHFASKAALFGMLMAEGCSQMLLPEENLFPAEVADLRPALEALGGRTLRFMLREDWLAIYRIAMAESVRFPELGPQFLRQRPGADADADARLDRAAAGGGEGAGGRRTRHGCPAFDGAAALRAVPARHPRAAAGAGGRRHRPRGCRRGRYLAAGLRRGSGPLIVSR